MRPCRHGPRSRSTWSARPPRHSSDPPRRDALRPVLDPAPSTIPPPNKAGRHSMSGATSSSKVLRSRALKASWTRRTISTASWDIFQGVCRRRVGGSFQAVRAASPLMPGARNERERGESPGGIGRCSLREAPIIRRNLPMPAKRASQTTVSAEDHYRLARRPAARRRARRGSRA